MSKYRYLFKTNYAIYVILYSVGSGKSSLYLLQIFGLSELGEEKGQRLQKKRR